MNAQKRRMREQEHKREIERLWQEKLAIYRAQREMELEERRAKEEDERRKAVIVEMERERLLREHGHILQQYHPKAATNYGATGFKWGGTNGGSWARATHSHIANSSQN